jgi:cell division protein FtsL
MATTARAAWMEAWEADLTPSAAAARSARRVDAQTRHTRYYTREATARVPREVEETHQAKALPELKVVTTRRPHWGLVAVVLVFCAMVLGCTIIAPVLINSAATQLESAAGQLETQQKQLTADNSSLSAQISALSSPNRVAEQAGRLGLVPAQSVYYVGAGTQTAATGADTAVAGR